MKTLKRIIALAICLILITISLAIADSQSSTTVTDMAGREVIINGSVDRLHVDWASGITLAMTLGATDKLVAVPNAFHTDTFAWCRIICPSLENIVPDDAIYQNIEAVLNYEPQLVITQTKDNIELYERLGLTVIYVKFNDVASFKQSIMIVGTALGGVHLDRANDFCNYMDECYALVQERTAGVADEDRPSVYYVDSRFVDAYHTVGTGEIQESWILAAGGKLATAPKFKGRNLEITAEEFLNIDPDIIVIGAQNQAQVFDLLMADPVLCELTAVKAGRVVRIPQGMFPWCRTGPESAMQPIWAGKLLHPELFEDISIIDIARNFYQRFYGTVLSDEQLTGILNGQLTPTAE